MQKIYLPSAILACCLAQNLYANFNVSPNNQFTQNTALTSTHQNIPTSKKDTALGWATITGETSETPILLTLSSSLLIPKINNAFIDSSLTNLSAFGIAITNGDTAAALSLNAPLTFQGIHGEKNSVGILGSGTFFGYQTSFLILDGTLNFQSISSTQGSSYGLMEGVLFNLPNSQLTFDSITSQNQAIGSSTDLIVMGKIAFQNITAPLEAIGQKGEAFYIHNGGEIAFEKIESNQKATGLIVNASINLGKMTFGTICSKGVAQGISNSVLIDAGVTTFDQIQGQNEAFGLNRVLFLGIGNSLRFDSIAGNKAIGINNSSLALLSTLPALSAKASASSLVFSNISAQEAYGISVKKWINFSLQRSSSILFSQITGTKSAGIQINPRGSFTISGDGTSSIQFKNISSNIALQNKGSLHIFDTSLIFGNSTPTCKAGICNHLPNSTFFSKNLQISNSILDHAISATQPTKIIVYNTLSLSSNKEAFSGAVEVELKENGSLWLSSNGGTLHKLTTQKNAEVSFLSAGRPDQFYSLNIANLNATSPLTFELFANKTSLNANAYLENAEKSNIGGSDIIIIQNATTPSSNHIKVKVANNNEDKRYFLLAKVQGTSKEKTDFEGLKNGESKEIIAQNQGFDRFKITLKRTDTQDCAYYYSDLIPTQSFISDYYIFPTGNALTANHTIFLANIDHLSLRLGELRNNPSQYGVWVRGFGGAREGNSIQYGNIQAGGDYAFGLKEATDFVGLALSYVYGTGEQEEIVFQTKPTNFWQSNAKYFYSSMHTQTHGIELLFYNSYIQDEGWYSDSTLRLSYFSSQVNLFLKDLKLNNFAYALSEEAGYRWKFFDRSFFIELGSKLTLGSMTEESFQQSITQDSIIYTLDAQIQPSSLLLFKEAFKMGYQYKSQSFSLGCYGGISFNAGGFLGDMVFKTAHNNQTRSLDYDVSFAWDIGVDISYLNFNFYANFEHQFNSNIFDLGYRASIGTRYHFST